MARTSPGTPIFATPSRRVLIVALVIVISMQGCVAGGLPGPDVKSGGAPVELSESGSQARNVILLIGDGMGPDQIEAARWEKAGHDPAAYTVDDPSHGPARVPGHASPPHRPTVPSRTRPRPRPRS